MWEFSALTVSYPELGVLSIVHFEDVSAEVSLELPDQPTLQVLQLLGLVNTGITRTVRGWVGQADCVLSSLKLIRASIASSDILVMV